MKKEIKVEYRPIFFEDLEKYEFQEEIAYEVDKKLQYLKLFPRMGSEISGGFRKIVLKTKSQIYIFTYKFYEFENKIVVFRIKNSKENNFESR